MAEIPVVVQDPEATLVFQSAASGGDWFANDGMTHLYCKNNGVGSETLTFTPQRVCSRGVLSHGTADQLTVTGSGVTTISLAFDPKIFNDVSGFVQVSYSDHTNLEVAAVRILPA